jgi:wyosine [tRNA(Phe)-imidazoG37] synthetase (radical SAM superfamily)
VERQEWFPLDDIIDELKGKLASRPDWITMSGSGEPTLYSRLRERYRGQYWLEVFILAGHTALRAEAGKIAACAGRIAPDRIQLNTVTRPPAEDYAAPVDRLLLEELSELFTPRAEVIADFRALHSDAEFSATRDTVLDLLRRRPCTLDDIAGGLGIHRNEAAKYVEDLLGRELIDRVLLKGRTCFRASPKD